MLKCFLWPKGLAEQLARAKDELRSKPSLLQRAAAREVHAWQSCCWPMEQEGEKEKCQVSFSCSNTSVERVARDLLEGELCNRPGTSCFSREGSQLVVDWRNTLEKGNTVPASHLFALEELLDYCHVHILSYVNTWSRQQAVFWVARHLLATAQGRQSSGSNCRIQLETSWRQRLLGVLQPELQTFSSGG